MDVVTGVVARFVRAQGFGIIALDGGGEVRFDVDACRFGFAVKEGVRVRVTLQKRASGPPRVREVRAS